ncbi:MAG: glycoside hydrolase family protein [Oscillatoria sp. SIO1A7]|nr:glycoside hydrolase family protein [Oscillatoria sp. SIO1A7]
MQYIVKSGDTLWSIAQRFLGDGDRWREIMKADGTTFTSAEAQNLKVGQSVYLPVSYQTGTGRPVNPPPSNGNSGSPPSTISDAGLKFIANHEGLRLSLYNDPAGHCTIGHGHLVHHGACNGSESAEFRQGISRQRALELLRSDANTAVQAVKSLVKVPLNQHQFDALVSFTFNLGAGNLQKSSLLARLNKGEYDAVPYELSRWVYAGGRKLPGLVRRRSEEGLLFEKGVYTGVANTGNTTPNPQPNTSDPRSKFELAKQAAIQRAGGTGVVGNPVGSPKYIKVDNGSGWYQEFKHFNGNKRLLSLKDGSGTAFWVHGDNLREFEHWGGYWGELGFPTNDETPFTSSSTGTKGVWQGFSGSGGNARIHNGSSPPISSTATWGSIASFYENMGAANSWLGLPTKAEWHDPDGVTIWAEFERGRIAHNKTNGENEAIPYPYKELQFILEFESRNTGKSAHQIANTLRGYTREDYISGKWTIVTNLSNPGYLGNQLNGTTLLSGQVTDFGHFIASLSDQVMHPYQLGNASGDWTSWAGDIGSAVIAYGEGRFTNLNTALDQMASESDYSADIAAVVVGAALNSSSGRRGSIASAIRKYDETSYSDNVKTFIREALGGKIEGKTLKNPADVEAAISRSVSGFVALAGLTLPDANHVLQGALHFLSYLVEKSGLDSFKFKPYRNPSLTILGKLDSEVSIPLR